MNKIHKEKQTYRFFAIFVAIFTILSSKSIAYGIDFFASLRSAIAWGIDQLANNLNNMVQLGIRMTDSGAPNLVQFDDVVFDRFEDIRLSFYEKD